MSVLTKPPLTLDARAMGVTAVNRELRAQSAGAEVNITEVRGAHNLGVGLTNKIHININGNAGYYLAGLCDGPSFTVNGSVGWGVGENLMSGVVRVRGNASESTAASAHGGLVVIEGDASSRAAISLKGGSLAVGGSVGHMSAFMAQAGTVLVGGDAGDSLGDSLYEAVIYVGGTIRSLGADAQIEEMTASDVTLVREMCIAAGFDHINPENVTKVASAKQLYNFDALTKQSY